MAATKVYSIHERQRLTTQQTQDVTALAASSTSLAFSDTSKYVIVENKGPDKVYVRLDGGSASSATGFTLVAGETFSIAFDTDGIAARADSVNTVLHVTAFS